MDHTIQSLVYVVEMGASQVLKLGERLETASPKQMEPILRSISKECDTLSAGLSRLSQHIDEMPSEKADKPIEAPFVDRRLIDVSILVSEAIERGFCNRCGGVLCGDQL